jgi:hypothetical protein
MNRRFTLRAKQQNDPQEETSMKTLKHFTIINVIVFMTCLPALSQVDVQQYLNADGTVNQGAIETAIARGADPAKLAGELSAERCAMAPEFAVSVVTAAPDVNVGVLTRGVIAAVIAACPDASDRVTEALRVATAPVGPTFQSTQAEDYRINKTGGSPSPSK